MSYLLGLPDGDCLLVFEADRTEVSSDLLLASAAQGRVIDRTRSTLEEALENLRPSLNKIVDVLRRMSPDEMGVEFGLKVGGETGLIIAKGTAEVNFVVRLSWKSSE